MDDMTLSFLIIVFVLTCACGLSYLAAWTHGMPACPDCCCKKEDLRTPLLYQEEFGV
jgi:hypothetical protein